MLFRSLTVTASDLVIQHLKESGTFRELTPKSPDNIPGKITIEGKSYWNYSSNDYLGLSTNTELIHDTQEKLPQFGMGATGSRLLSGDSTIYHKLEQEIAKTVNKDSALFFNCGYMANVGLISTLFNRHDVIFADKYCHASIIDGIKLSGATCHRFMHLDNTHLETLLKIYRSNFKNALIVTESMFSMHGDSPDLEKLVQLKKTYDCKLMVDEAHTFGVIGEKGQGLVAHSGYSANEIGRAHV